MNIIDELKSQIIDEVSSNPQGPLGKLLKELNDAEIPPVLRDDLANNSDIDISMIDGNTKVDNNLGNEGKFPFK